MEWREACERRMENKLVKERRKEGKDGRGGIALYKNPCFKPTVAYLFSLSELLRRTEQDALEAQSRR
jgi:hypothetical protein